MSEAQLGKIVSEETGRRISEALTGKPLSEEHRRKISETKKGTHPSDESRRKMSEAQKQRQINEKKRRNNLFSYWGYQFYPLPVICQQNTNMNSCIRSIHLHPLLTMTSFKDTLKPRVHGILLVYGEK
jgi:hypothetical protein